MKHILSWTYVNENYASQPDSLKESVAKSYSDEMEWKIEFHDIVGTPVIYFPKAMEWYTVGQDWTLSPRREPSRNDQDKISLNIFNEMFWIDGDKLSETFAKRANIENQLYLILYPESIEKYFLELLESFSPEEKTKILQALELCKKYHAGQMRDEWVEYYSHPIFVAIKWIEYKSSVDDILVLLLHDTIEDTELSYEEIERKFWEKVAQGVKWMSKNEYSSEEEYYEAISNDESLAYYKWLDRLANIYSLNFSDTAKRERYIKATQEVVLPIVEKYHPELAEEIREVLEYLKAGNINSLPREVQSRLQDLQKISEIRWWLEE